MAAKIKEKIDASVEGKLKSLYQLQLIDSKIDRLRTVRGELPLEVSDLEDTVLGLETRLKNVELEVSELDTTLNEKKQAIKDFQANIKKYEQQQGKVRNNREYDAITKEIEFQNLEIQLAEKRIKEAKANIALSFFIDVIDCSDLVALMFNWDVSISRIPQILIFIFSIHGFIIGVSQIICESIFPIL